MSPKEVRDHVLRSRLPWRSEEGALTECGLPAQSYPTVTPEEMRAKIAAEGQRRAAYSSCMTCWSALSNTEWREARGGKLFATLAREVDRSFSGGDGPPVLVKELEAIVLLIERHREEWDALMSDLAGVVNLREVRRQKAEGK